MSEAYAICSESKCKRLVYTAEQADAKFFKITDMAVIEADFTMTIQNSIGYKTLKFPDGFTRDNSIIIGGTITNKSSGQPIMIPCMDTGGSGVNPTIYFGQGENSLSDIYLNIEYADGYPTSTKDFNIKLAVYKYKD